MFEMKVNMCMVKMWSGGGVDYSFHFNLAHKNLIQHTEYTVLPTIYYVHCTMYTVRTTHARLEIQWIASSEARDNAGGGDGLRLDRLRNTISPQQRRLFHNREWWSSNTFTLSAYQIL